MYCAIARISRGRGPLKVLNDPRHDVTGPRRAAVRIGSNAWNLRHHWYRSVVAFRPAAFRPAALSQCRRTPVRTCRLPASDIILDSVLGALLPKVIWVRIGNCTTHPVRAPLLIALVGTAVLGAVVPPVRSYRRCGRTAGPPE